MLWKNTTYPAALLAFALTLCASGCAFSAQPGAASQISVPCGPIASDRFIMPITPTLKWAPDGSGILFNKGNRLYTVGLDGSNLYNLARSTPSDQSFAHDAAGTFMGLFADISPDGS